MTEDCSWQPQRDAPVARSTTSPPRSRRPSDERAHARRPGSWGTAARGATSSRPSSSSPSPGRHAASFRTTRPARLGREKSSCPTTSGSNESVPLPEVSERDLVAHFTRLTHRQYSVDLGAYPLGSCTMKYNPKSADAGASFPGFAQVHPAAPGACTQGWLELLVELEESLCEITGMAAATLQPAAGAAGELTGLLLDARLPRGQRASPSADAGSSSRTRRTARTRPL